MREAALIDGANEYSIFFRIMLPLTLPALAVLATLQFTWIWNDFLWPFILTQRAESRTVMVGILNLTGQYTVDWGGQAAASLIGSLPTLFHICILAAVFYSRSDAGRGEGVIVVAHDNGRKNCAAATRARKSAMPVPTIHLMSVD